MSTFKVPLIEIKSFGKHPNADNLSISHVEGNPVIFRTNDFKVGDKAIYIPIDSVVPVKNKYFSFLTDREDKTHIRIKAKKIRGIFSMGILISVKGILDKKTDLNIGLDLAKDLGIIKYEEPIPTHMNTGNEKDPQFMPVYDIENYRKYKELLIPKEEVIVTEKIHGCNARFAWKDGRLWVGSHKTIKKEDPNNLWWKVAIQERLDKKLNDYLDGFILYGEIYGSIQDLKYGVKNGEFKFAAFDIFDIANNKFMDYDKFTYYCSTTSIPMVPVLYNGPYIQELIEPLANGKSTLANNIKEGFVIKPIKERWNEVTGRTILKLISEEYMLRKNGTELH